MMHAKLISPGASGQRTHVMIFDTGDEVLAELTAYVEREHLLAAQFVAIGAFSRAVVAYFDWQSRQYQKIPIAEQVEVLVLTGDVSEDENRKPKIHAHVVVGKRDGSAHGGHLIEAHVRPTLELVLTESPSHLRRRFDPTSGLSLIRLENN